MSKIKLTYFDFHGGRAEPIRMALSMGGIEFEDVRISFAEFRELRDGYPLKAIPTMEVDGVVYTQCNAMTRYAGRLTGLYPEDAWDAFLCDELLDAAEDASNAINKSMFLEGDALKEARAELVDGPLTMFLNFFATRLDAAQGGFFVSGELTVADLKVFAALNRLQSGVLEHVPTDLIDKIAPQLLEHQARVAEHPKVSAYLAGLS